MAKPKLNLNLSGTSNLQGTVMETIKNMETRNKEKDTSLSEPRTFKRISHKKIRSSELNDYPIENIEEAEILLLQYGLLEPFSVNYDEDTNTYELESGDRRFHAIQNLFDKYENSEEESSEKSLYMKNIHCLYVDGIYCMVENGSRDRDEVRARIIVHNESTRPFDAMRTASKINELAQIYTRQNNLLPKNERFNVNEKISEQLKGKYTVRQIIRYKNFDKLIDELKNVIIKHNMSISEIGSYHSMTEEEQSVLAKYIETYHEDGHKLELPTIDEIKSIVASTIEEETNSSEEDTIDFSSGLTDIETEETIDDTSTEKSDNQNHTDSPDNQFLEELKATAAKKIKEGKDKKDKKINETVLAIQKKSSQLEKVLYSYIDEETTEIQIDFEQLSAELDSIIDKLTSIKSSIKR